MEINYNNKYLTPFEEKKLFYACYRDNIEELKQLLLKNNVDINYKTASGNVCICKIK